jgi:hypothetical protein
MEPGCPCRCILLQVNPSHPFDLAGDLLVAVDQFPVGVVGIEPVFVGIEDRGDAFADALFLGLQIEEGLDV